VSANSLVRFVCITKRFIPCPHSHPHR
jgi:hypothetical protein